MLRFPSDSVKASYVNISWVLKDFYTRYNIPVKSTGHIYLFGNIHSILANIFYQFFLSTAGREGYITFFYYYCYLVSLPSLSRSLPSSLFLSSFLFLSEIVSRQPRLALNSLYNHGWPWTPDQSTPKCWDLGLQVCTILLIWQGF